jgi:signal transduction histidine kinase
VTALGAWLITLFSVIEAVRARRERQRTAEHSRNETLRRQIAAERLRIAHDLHDTVAHHMSLINLQAGVALHLADDAQPQIRESLATIKASSKQALGELRSILGVLRDVDVDDPGTGSAHTDLPPDEGAGVRAAPRLPTPSLADLDELIEATRRAGVEVASHIALEGADIPTPVQVAAYRIVQESLTNVARHARPASADVTIGFDGNELTIDIANPTSSPSHLLGRGTTGNGLIGMRERAESIGGQLTAGPRLAGDFTVHARLPIGPAS